MPPLPQTWDAKIVSTTREANRVELVFDVYRFGVAIERVTFTADDSLPRPPHAIRYGLACSPLPPP